jgi:quinolinate synthase
MWSPLSRVEDYERFSEEDLVSRILDVKSKMGGDLIILGHHYQRPKITKLSDFVGDSFGLSEKAAHSTGKKIVFCGVRFMAESAAILCQKDQCVYHPDPEAGCPMADMASLDDVQAAWSTIQKWAGDEKVIPITYMNSTAELKAFCGEREGIVCTSSNASKSYKWAFDRGDKIFFFPDEHLGRNTARAFNIAPEAIALWKPQEKNGGLTEDQVKRAEVILWGGHCPVHMEFKARDIKHVRQYYPGAKVVVHPECEQDVLLMADASGSTDFIVKYVAQQPPKSTTFVGTEVNLVTRLQSEFPDRKVYKLQRSLCLTMYQINLANLCFTLDHLETLEKVKISENVKTNALIALNRMLNL